MASALISVNSRPSLHLWEVGAGLTETRALQCGCQKMLLTHWFLVLGGQSQAPSWLEGTFSVFFVSLGVSVALMLP